MKKKVFVMLIISVLLLLGACANANNIETEKEGKVISEETPLQETNKETSNDEKKEELKQLTGTYVGQIDGNSVEVIVENEPMALRTSEVADKIKELKENQEITVWFEENEHGQKVVKKIESK